MEGTIKNNRKGQEQTFEKTEEKKNCIHLYAFA